MKTTKPYANTNQPKQLAPNRAQPARPSKDSGLARTSESRPRYGGNILNSSSKKPDNMYGPDIDWTKKEYETGPDESIAGPFAGSYTGASYLPGSSFRVDSSGRYVFPSGLAISKQEAEMSWEERHRRNNEELLRSYKDDPKALRSIYENDPAMRGIIKASGLLPPEPTPVRQTIEPPKRYETVLLAPKKLPSSIVNQPAGNRSTQPIQPAVRPWQNIFSEARQEVPARQIQAPRPTAQPVSTPRPAARPIQAPRPSAQPRRGGF